MILAYWTHVIERDGWIGTINESLLSLTNMHFNASDCIWIVPGTWESTT